MSTRGVETFIGKRPATKAYANIHEMTEDMESKLRWYESRISEVHGTADIGSVGVRWLIAAVRRGMETTAVAEAASRLDTAIYLKQSLSSMYSPDEWAAAADEATASRKALDEALTKYRRGGPIILHP